MTADQALAAHRRWKDQFRVHMATREPLDVCCIGADDQCEFGRWLYSTVKAWCGDSAIYHDCVAAHAEFHRAAAAVAVEVNAGHLLAAERMLAPETPYARASERLGICLMAIFRARDAARSSSDFSETCWA